MKTIKFAIGSKRIIILFSLLLICSFAKAQFYTAASLGIVANGPDQTANLNTALARTDVKTIWFNNSTVGVTESDFLINGTVTVPPGKVLKFEAYNVLVGPGTVTGGIIDASLQSRIFDTALTVNPVAGAQGWFSVKWYGALGNNSADDYKPIQMSIDACIRNNIERLIVPQGTAGGGAKYLITRPLIERNYLSDFFTLDLSGETSLWGTYPQIATTFKNTFAIGIQMGKGCKVRNLNIAGQFIPPAMGDLFTYYNMPFSSFTDGSSRDQPNSPYAAIAIDPFRNLPGDGLPSDGGYPGLSAQYGISPSPASTTTGSTAISIEDVFIAGFVVGVVSSPNGLTQNAEVTKISRAHFTNCKLCISGGQTQEKQNVADGIVCWSGIHTVFGTGLYGSGGQGNWYITNVSLQSVIQFINNSQGGFFPSYINNVYAESLGSFGTLMSGSSIIASLASQVSNCNFNFEGYDLAGFQILANTSQGVTFKNCSFRYYSTGKTTMMVFNSSSTFEDCSFSGIPIQKAQLSVGTYPTIYNNCNAAVYYFGQNVFKTSTKQLDSILYQNNYTITDYATEGANNLTEKYALQGKDVFVNFIDNATSQGITVTSHTTSFAATNRNAYYLGGVVLFSSGLTINFTNPIGYGYVTAITPGAGTTGTISVAGLSTSVVTGSYNLSCFYPAIQCGTFMGNITNGTTITKIAQDYGRAPAGYVGSLIKVPYNNSTFGWAKVINYDAPTNTFTTLGNNGSVFTVIDTALYFNNDATKTVETSSEANQTIASATTPLIFYKGELLTQLVKSDVASTYVCVKTGYNKLALAPVGETRQAVIEAGNSFYSWNTNGNTGTVDGTNFIGTTDNVPLSFIVNNHIAGKIKSSMAANTSLGYRTLEVTTSLGNAAFGNEVLNKNTGGGSNSGFGDRALLNDTSGFSNVAFGQMALSQNSNGFENSAIGGSALLTNKTGNNNTALGFQANVSVDGLNNATAIGYLTVVSQSNTMLFGNTSVIGWGFGANPTSGNAIVVGTNSTNGNGAFLTTGGTWTNTSDKNLKDDITNIDSKNILSLVSQLPISKWKYKGTNEYHVGPMAQDFYKIFGLGNDDKHISTIDPSGISLAAIQELLKRIDALQQEVNLLQKQIGIENR